MIPVRAIVKRQLEDPPPRNAVATAIVGRANSAPKAPKLPQPP